MNTIDSKNNQISLLALSLKHTLLYPVTKLRYVS